MGRVGTKKSDRRWRDPYGIIWDSEFEYEVSKRLNEVDQFYRRCEKGGSDTFSYGSHVRSGECLVCGSGEVIQRRSYSPDLFCSKTKRELSNNRGYYLEIKGYWTATKRRLFRDFRKAEPSIDIRIIFQGKSWYRGKLSFEDYMQRYFKGVKYMIWPWNKRRKNQPEFILPEGW